MAKSNADESTSSSVSMKTNYTTTTFLPPLPPPSTDAFLTLQLADYLDMHQERTTTTDSPKHNTAFTTRETGSDSIPSPLLPRLQIHPHKNDSPSSSPPSSSSLSSLSSSSDDDACTISPLLWVPADHHPEIAPGEFSKWLETNGSNNLARRKSSLRRKSSVLSQTHNASEDEDEDDNSSTLCQSPPSSMTQSTSLMAIPESNDELKGNILDFDRHSPSQDTSRVLAPRANRSLLRRSAFSARGRGRRLTTSTRRHGSDDNSSLDEAVPVTQYQHHENGGEEEKSPAETVDQPREPVRLYDRPVSMNEWIDLGCASLPGSPGGDSQQGILSRVHDAESHILSQLSDDTTTAPSDTDPMPLDPATDRDIDPEAMDDGIAPTAIPISPTIDHTSSDLFLSNQTPSNQNRDVLVSLIPTSQPDQTTPLPTRKELGDKDASIISSQSLPNAVPTTPIPSAKSEFAQSPSPPMPTTKKEHSIQRASSERSPTKQERKSKSSWFGGLFGHNGSKEKRRGSLRRVEDERCAQEKQQQRRHDKQDTHPLSLPTQTKKEAVATHKKSGLGSLFSRHNKSESKHTNSSKRHHFQKFQQHVMTGVTLAAPLLLSNGPTAAHKKALPTTTKPDRPTCYHSYRLPIHVERAIYRLSHFKLADPRRPLRHQVAISNLMFWYLSIINTQSDHPTLLSAYAQQQQQQQPTNTILVSSTGPPPHSTRHAHFDETANQRIQRPLATANDDDDDGDDDLPLSYYKQG